MKLTTATDSAPRPWERQEGESDAEWAAFLDYRNIGVRRTIKAVQDARGETHKLVYRYAQTRNWRARAAAWDAHADAVFIETFLSRVRELADEQADLATKMIRFADAHFETSDPANARPSTAVRAAEVAAKLATSAADLAKRTDSGTEALTTLADTIAGILTDRDPDTMRTRMETLETSLRALLPARGVA